MHIGDEVYVHGYVDEIRSDVVIIRNNGGYFGTIPEEVLLTGIEYLADRKTEPTGYNLSPVEDEPQTIDPKRGEWIVDGRDFYGGIEWCHCSVCGNHESTDSVYTNTKFYPFCARCGARMNSSEIPNNCEDETQTEPLQTCSVNGRPYSECSSCEHFKCTADEPQTDCAWR